ncbi:MAG TPA: hypothetical protein VID29_05360 [Solirubrobacteraceae bacterium]|jgi:hypothetical protein
MDKYAPPPPRPLRVGVIPPSAHSDRPRLWDALEMAYPVRFQARERGALRDLDAVVRVGEVLVGEAQAHAAGLPCLRAAATPQTPDDATPADPGAVAPLPAELAPGEALRERLRPDRHRALLALARFLRELTAPGPAPLHAAFVIDDPNLRRRRYGHIDYARLLAHARGHGYHMSIATVPLDARLADPRAVRVFAAGTEHLSLCVHGNDHDGPELGRPHSYAQSLALVAQAVRRVAGFEARTGLAVERVMAPPHERLAEPVAHALRACGFRAVTSTRPYPWVASTPAQSWLARPPAAGPLAAWGPVDVVAGGLPVLLRADFEHPRADLALRAFLGQPLILYGHHDLLADGAERLAAAAAQIQALGDVRWGSLATIARALAPSPATAAPLANGPASAGPAPAPPPLDAHSLAAIPAPRRRLRPRARRLLSEGRDRAGAALRRTPGPAAARVAPPTSSSART